MRILGLDIGSKTIGVAISDELGWTAQPLKTIQRKTLPEDMEKIKNFISGYQVQEIVAGIPKNMQGGEGEQAKKVREFLKELKHEVRLPVKTWDERFTTAAAERTLLEGDLSRAKRKKMIDQVAAQVILQGYLDRLNLKKNRTL